MIDSRMVGVPFNAPTLFTARFAGNATGALTTVASTSKKVTVARTGVGALTVTLNDAAPPATTGGLVGVIQASRFWVNSANAVSPRHVSATPVSANSAAFTLQVYTLDYANATMVAADLASTEELNCEIWTARTSVP